MIVHVNDYLVYKVSPGQEEHTPNKPQRERYKMARDEYGYLHKVKKPFPRVTYDIDSKTKFTEFKPPPDDVYIPAPIVKRHHLSEREQHIVLKQIGKDWLASNGYSNIRFEVKLNADKRNFIRADVYGEKDSFTAIVECGGSRERKLEKASRIVTHIFILPYGFSVPFLWNPNMELCQTCGHPI